VPKDRWSVSNWVRFAALMPAERATALAVRVLPSLTLLPSEYTCIL